jgi:hypothetical protein
VNIGATSTAAVVIGSANLTALDIIVDNATANVFQLRDTGNDYINLNTATPELAFGNATTNPKFSWLGAGRMEVDGDSATSFRIEVLQDTVASSAGRAFQLFAGGGGTGNGSPGGAGGVASLEAGFGGDGTTSNAGAGGLTTVKGGDAGADGGGGGAVGGNCNISGGNGSGAFSDGTVNIGATSTAAVVIGSANLTALDIIVDNTTANVFQLRDTGNDYINLSTDTPDLSFGNGTTNPTYQFLGSGTFTVAGASTIQNSLSIDSATAANNFLDFDNGAGAAVSAANHVRLRSNAGVLEASQNGGAWTVVATGTTPPGGADTQLQYNNAGAFGGTSQLTYDGTNLTSTTAIFADGGVDRSGAATLTLGTTNATAITIGAVGVTTTVAGDLQVDGAETVTGTSTFTDSATFNGNVTFGNAATDTVQFGASDATGARVGPAGSPNMHFVLDVDHLIDVDQSTDETAGHNLTIAASAGGDTAGVAAGGAGGTLTLGGQVGGAGDGTQTAGAGGVVAIVGGAGGTAVSTGGVGGAVTIDAGAGTGAAADGAISIGATTAASITLGNAIGTTIDDYALFPERATAPSTAANEGALYTKDDGGESHLFFRSDSDGTEYQLTPNSVSPAGTTATASENIAAGAPVNYHNSGGNPRIQESDANGGGTRENPVGLAQAAITSGNAGNVVQAGEVDVPDAQWDSVPVVGDVGEPAYVSTTVGNLTLTAPGAGAIVVRVGYISQGGTGQVKVLVNVGEPVKTQ